MTATVTQRLRDRVRPARRTSRPDVDVDLTDLDFGVDAAGVGTDRLQHRWTGGSAMASRVATLGLGAAMLAGPAALVMQLAAPAPELVSAPVLSTPAATVTEAAAAAQRAQALVVAWLTATSDSSDQLRALWAGQVNLPDRAVTVGDTQIASVLARGEGLWSVTVAAQITSPGAKTAALRYFQVPVTVTSSGPSAVPLAQPATLPAPVPAPAAAPASSVAYSEDVPAEAPLTATVTTFLSAFVSGQDVSRLTSPGSTVATISPPLASRVLVDQLKVRDGDGDLAAAATPAEGGATRVLVMVDLVAADGQTRTATYPLSVRARGGRWEVSAIDPTPALEVAGAASP